MGYEIIWTRTTGQTRLVQGESTQSGCWRPTTCGAMRSINLPPGPCNRCGAWREGSGRCPAPTGPPCNVPIFTAVVTTNQNDSLAITNTGNAINHSVTLNTAGSTSHSSCNGAEPHITSFTQTTVTNHGTNPNTTTAGLTELQIMLS